jgi:hypothetical protein
MDRSSASAKLVHEIQVLSRCQKAPVVTAMARCLTCLPGLAVNDVHVLLAVAGVATGGDSCQQTWTTSDICSHISTSQVLSWGCGVPKTVLDGEVVGPEPNGSLITEGDGEVFEKRRVDPRNQVLMEPVMVRFLRMGRP